VPSSSEGVVARQTTRASEIVPLVSYVADGRAGQRMLIRLAINCSDDTCWNARQDCAA
jgi:hypothetical protein